MEKIEANKEGKEGKESKEANLLKIYLIASLIGIFLLLFISSHIEPNFMNIGDITESNLNQRVKILANITNIQDYNGFQVMTVKDSTGKIQVTLNSKTPFNETIYKNQDNSINKDDSTSQDKSIQFLIIGKVTEYEGKLQISADKITEVTTES